METDNGKRGNAGVVVSLRVEKNNKYKIIMDDVTNTSSDACGPWKHKVVVTWKDYDKDELEELNLSEEELASFGHYVLARLMAIKNN